ncbi:MAG TPA: MFS transporter [Methanocorpusculum sp.]|nr:MFS transporter [Methanocorpusculum sp.]
MGVDLSRRGPAYLFMIVAAVAVFMDYLDSSIVAIALPEIAADFAVTSSTSSWVLISYLLSIGCSLVICGKIADRTGKYKLIFTTGFILFTVASLFCGLAPSMTILIICRFIQGFAAAFMCATATSLINLHLPTRIQAIATGVIATGGGIALAAGPGIGGLLTDVLSWHWIFFINVPIGILGILGALFLIPRDRPVEKPTTRFDGIGAGLFAVTMVALLTGLDFGAQENWPVYSIILVCIAPIFGAVFIWYELRHHDPVLSAQLFKNRTVMFASLSTTCSTAAFFGSIFILPFYFAAIGYSALVSGLILLISPACIALAGIPSGMLSIRYGCRFLCTLGTLIQAIGMGVLIAGIFSALIPLIIVGLVISGIGSGLNEGPSIRRITIHSPLELQGSSGGLVFTCMNVGCVLGVALFSVVAAAASGSPDYTIFGITISCILGALFALIACVTSQAARDTIKS